MSIALPKFKIKILVVILSLISTFSAAIMVTGIKILSSDLNPFVLAFYRCFFGLIIILPFLFLQKYNDLKTKNIKLQFLRCSINVYSMISWFIAIGTLQLEKAAAIGFTTPLFTTLLAIIFLGEVIKIHRITALIVGFIGILVVIRPGFVEIEPDVLWLLSAAFSFSFVIIIVKKLTEKDTSLTTAFYHMLFLTPPTFVISLFYWQNINLNHFMILLIVAIAGFITQVTSNQSLKMSDTSFVMPLQFTNLIWLSFIGYALFAELPNIWTWLGGIIIFSAVIYITLRESIVKKDQPNSKQIDKAIIE
jgi:drug/metabolite transporter (DMT)-like permease|tara:strand:+ start:81 stop:998 length:918 start_codon:yes stop_codon:yes gene_type:complete